MIGCHYCKKSRGKAALLVGENIFKALNYDGKSNTSLLLKSFPKSPSRSSVEFSSHVTAEQLEKCKCCSWPAIALICFRFLSSLLCSSCFVAIYWLFREYACFRHQLLLTELCRFGKQGPDTASLNFMGIPQRLS